MLIHLPKVSRMSRFWIYKRNIKIRALTKNTILVNVSLTVAGLDYYPLDVVA